MRYLVYEQLRTNLSIGKPVEQWLSPRVHPNYVELRALTILKERDGTYTTSYVGYFDDGDESFTDIYAFSYPDPDDPEVIKSFDSIDEALHFAMANYNASPDKFVNSGLLQDEYKDYLKTRGK